MHQLEGFELVEEVSRTSSAIIYKAKELDHNRYVFLKVYPLAPSPNPERHRIVHEMRTLARLLPPHFQQILDARYSEEAHWLILEYFEGARLDQVIMGSPIGREPTIQLARKLALALRDAYYAGVAHCNLRLSNVFLIPGQQIKITGLEYSRPLWEGYQPNPDKFSEAEWGSLHIPPDPIAPEQRLRITRAIGLRTDVFAWGVILYQLINWTTKIDELLEKIETGALPEAGGGFTLLPGCPALEAICRKCLQYYSDDRYPDGNALVEDLERVLGSL